MNRLGRNLSGSVRLSGHGQFDQFRFGGRRDPASRFRQLGWHGADGDPTAWRQFATVCEAAAASLAFEGGGVLDRGHARVRDLG